VVIFDEAVAHLDPITERDMWQTLRALRANRAALIIMLRLIGPETADEISVLPLGHVIERGCHSELIGCALFSV
jgi:ABC-type multidrug transport system fused ATPase/permease subunit